MVINKITINKLNDVKIKVTRGTRNLQKWQLGQRFENGRLRYQEAYVMSNNYFKRISAAYDKLGKIIKGSIHREEVAGEKAMNMEIHNFSAEV